MVQTRTTPILCKGEIFDQGNPVSTLSLLSGNF
jgi:hypothetical protein